jgi:hypothetical protein
MEEIEYVFIGFLLQGRFTLKEAVNLPPDLRAKIYPVFLKELGK